ncbi:MAG: DNA cytosine methyltransferase [Anaerolineales bacterium]|nr:DNA cytosine methyltransferase [Anaerolineales bacterium]
MEDLSVIADKLESVDILTAGFPCQPFSIAETDLALKMRGVFYFRYNQVNEGIWGQKTQNSCNGKRKKFKVS